MIKEIKPEFYKEFQCSAEECPITCCQEWRIELDEPTQKKWETLDFSKLGHSEMDAYISKEEDCAIINQNEEKQCCFLNEKKLCTLVTTYGENVLSKTCTMFPREIHEFEKRKEYTLTTCCPEVVELLKQQETLRFTEDLTEMNMGRLFAIRTMLMDIMEKKEFTISKSFMIDFYILLQLYKTEDKLTHQEIHDDLDQYKGEAVLKELSEAIDGMEFSKLGTLEETNELFLDLVQNYKEEERYNSYLEPLLLIAESVSRSYQQETMLKQLELFEQQFSSFETLLRNLVVMELYNSSIMPESKLKDMVVKMQWIALEYAMMKHSVLLKWMADPSKPVEDAVVRDYIVIVSRMMGYDEEGIVKYLNRSFQSLLWEWGYLALVVGSGE